MTIGERIRARRKDLGLSVDEVAEKLGKDRATVYRYESNDIENLPLGILEPLARVLRASPQYLMGWGDSFRGFIWERVPLLGDIAAGEPLLMRESHETYVATSTDCPIDFCLQVKGDSMIDARINDGDLVFVRRQSSVENGEIAVVMIDDEATLKRFYQTNGGVILKAENSKYQPKYYTVKDFKDIRILGKAVFFQSQI